MYSTNNKMKLFGLAIFSCSIFLGVNSNMIRTQGAADELRKKVAELNQLTSHSPIVRLNYKMFNRLVRFPPRDYSFIIMFTVLSRERKCAVCHMVNEEFVIVANSYKLFSANNKLFFGVVDYDQATSVFEVLKLKNAPAIIHFPAREGAKRADNFDIERFGIQAEAIARFIEERTDIQIKIFRPPNYYSTAAIVTLASLFLVILYLGRNQLDFLQNRQMWAIGAVYFSLAMSSGQMWNQIRGAPLYHTEDTRIVLISGNSNEQSLLESYLMIIFNCAVVVGMILMVEGGGGVYGAQASTKKSESMVLTGLSMVCIFYSIILAIFKYKSDGYPYSFLFK